MNGESVGMQHGFFHAKEGREVPRATLLLHHFNVGICEFYK